MKIKVNGEELQLAATVAIDELLVIAKAEAPEYVTVQLNEEILKRDELATVFLNEGDEVEFLYFMGGGSCHALD